jgi:hypothetical protein
MHVRLGDPAGLVIGSLANLVFGFWAYLRPGHFARLIWLRGFSPFRTKDDPMRSPPRWLLSFIKIMGLLEIWCAVIAPVVYWVLWATGVGSNEPPPAI